MKNQKIIKICEEKFIYLNYSPRTRDNYLSHIRPFLESLGDKQIIHCNSSDFQSYLDNYNFTSISQQNQVINAIRFLYKEVLNKKYDKVSFKRPKSEKKLPLITIGYLEEPKEIGENVVEVDNQEILTILFKNLESLDVLERMCSEVRKYLENKEKNLAD
jgi:site-specific recombinase XerD